jgi:hypothetical protein
MTTSSLLHLILAPWIPFQAPDFPSATPRTPRVLSSDEGGRSSACSRYIVFTYTLFLEKRQNRAEKSREVKKGPRASTCSVRCRLRGESLVKLYPELLAHKSRLRPRLEF